MLPLWDHLASLGLGLGNSLGDLLGDLLHLFGDLSNLFGSLLGDLLGDRLHLFGGLGNLLDNLLSNLLDSLLLVKSLLHLLLRRGSAGEAQVDHWRSREVVGLVGMLGDGNSRGVLLDGSLGPLLGSLLDQIILLLKNSLHSLLGSLQAVFAKLVLAQMLASLLHLQASLLHSGNSSSTRDLLDWTDSTGTATLPGSFKDFNLLLVGMLVFVLFSSLEGQELGSMVHEDVGELLLLRELSLLLSESLLLLGLLVGSLPHLTNFFAEVNSLGLGVHGSVKVANLLARGLQFGMSRGLGLLRLGQRGDELRLGHLRHGISGVRLITEGDDNNERQSNEHNSTHSDNNDSTLLASPH